MVQPLYCNSNTDYRQLCSVEIDIKLLRKITVVRRVQLFFLAIYDS